MPTGKNWVNFLLVNIIFIGYVAITIAISNAQDIKDNWPEYRCNPLYMPFASNMEENFSYCVQNITNSISGDILQPITYTTSVLTDSVGGLSFNINSVREMINQIRNSTSGIFESIFGVFLNLTISVQRLIIGIKDMVGKIIGILVTLMYIMSGAVMTMNSAWKGPTGQLVKALGKCFHPETKIKLNNGKIKEIKDLELNDELINGKKVDCVLKFDNTRNKEILYEINNGENDEVIYVTGEHYIYQKRKMKFCKVKNDYNRKESKVTTDVLYCLMVEDNIIKIGDNTFWDYNDDCLMN
jgi:hypothetical protein